ncbi:MAG: pyrroline-5-carboxylate reductase family protein [Bacilli bacterium]
MEYYNIGFIGFGNMGKALGLGLISKNYNVYYNDLIDMEISGVTYADVETILSKCKYIVLAIKPYHYEEFLNNHDVRNNIIISIAAGITSAFMEKFCNKFILTMPNTPATLKLGYTVMVKNDQLTDDEFETVRVFFNSVGKTKIINEEELSKYICLSGSSPAYFFMYIDCLSTAMSKLGIEKTESEKILAHVMKATSEMLLQEGNSAKQLYENVCSPNGTTIEAINVFKDNKFEEICYNAIKNCFEKAEKMKK